MVVSKTYTRIDLQNVVVVAVMNDGTIESHKVPYNKHIDGTMAIGYTAAFQLV